MLAAGLLARNANRKGLKSKPWVKTTLGPGLEGRHRLLRQVGPRPAELEQLGFYTVGYGCTVCIGNTGPLIDEVSAAINDNDLAVTAVLSGNRNFEGRISPDVKMNYLACPPLVIAYALAGSMNFDFETDALGRTPTATTSTSRTSGRIAAEVQKTIDSSISTEMFTKEYGAVFDGDERWRSLPTPDSEVFEWDANSTYVRKPPYFDGMTLETSPVADITGARVLAKLGDSVTTDHISPAGNIKADSPAGRVPAGARRRPQGLQLLRLASRQPRGDDPRHLREHPPARTSWLRRRRRAATPATSRRRMARSRSSTTPAMNYQAAGTPLVIFARQGVRLRLEPRLGGQGHQACSASRRSSPRASSASTART